MKLSNNITKFLSKEAQSFLTEGLSSKTLDEQIQEVQEKIIILEGEILPSSIDMRNGGKVGK